MARLVEMWRSGQFIGDEASVEPFKQHVLAGLPETKVIAIFQPNPAARKYMPYLASGAFPLVCLPCFWPHALILSPCLIYSYMKAKASIEAMRYVVTDKGLYQWMMDYQEPCCACCSSGNDYQELNWAMVMNISVNNAGRGCGPCKMDSFVSLSSMPGGAVVHNGRAVNMGWSWYVENPNEVSALIRAVKAEVYGESAMTMGMGALGAMRTQQPGMQPMAGMMPMSASVAVAQAPVRIFVALHTTPDHKVIFMLDKAVHRDMPSFTAAACDKLGVTYEPGIQVILASVNAAITSPDELSAGDIALVNATAPPAYKS